MLNAETCPALFRLVMPVVLFVTFLANPCSAQINGKIADKPIAIWYARDVTPGRMIDYVTTMSERLDIGSTMRTQYEQQTHTQIEGMQPGVDEPVYGVAWYMVAGIIPSFESVTFQPVVDENDARRLLNAWKADYGELGYMEDLGNGCFTLGYRYSNETPLPEIYDESQVMANNSLRNRGRKHEQKIVEKDGKKFLEATGSMTEYSRFFDNVLYKATFEELLEMELPSSASVTSSVSRSNDLGFDAYLDRIPIGIRQLGWNMLTAAVGTQLQQHDDESETTYNMRRSSGDLGLALSKAVLFDIDNSSGWMRFASDEDDSLRGELRIRARNNSELTKQLPAAAGLSRFAPLLNDNAAATVHLCVRFPEEAPAALLAMGTWFQETIDRESGSDPSMVDSARVLSEALAGIADHRNLEVLAKIGWTEGSGGVIYGGIQASENPRLLHSVQNFLTHAPGTPPRNDDTISLSEDDGRPLIRVILPNEAIESVAAESGLQISHLYLMHEGSRLWFAAGAENAIEILRQSIDRCHEGGLAFRTPLFTASLDMERWLAYPQEDASGIAPLPHWLDENAWWFPPNPLTYLEFSEQEGKPDPIMQRAFDLGGAQQASFSVQADESGLLVQAAIGKALANHMLARMIDARENMIKRMQEQQNEAAEKAKEAAAAALLE